MEIAKEIDKANLKTIDNISDADPVWIDIRKAIEVAGGMEENMILHSGPPIGWENMCELHRNGIMSGILFEGWAKNKEEAVKLVESGKIEIESALDHNVVGSGVGIITPSVSLIVVKDQKSGKIGCSPPSEGIYRGGLCSWGLYSEEIKNNLIFMRDKLFPAIVKILKRKDGISLKPIIAQGLQMGDENHTRQVAADALLAKSIMSELIRLDIEDDLKVKVVDYLTKTERIFHPLGQSSCLSALLAASNIKNSSVVTALAGNGVDYGIKVSGMGDEWFTYKAPKVIGKFISTDYSENDVLPWLGDSCVVEASGLGGFAVAASPIVMQLRGEKIKDAINQTNEMRNICVGVNRNYLVPNIDFAPLPLGIDIRKVLDTGISPVIHGGMINREGGLIGAGSARVPIECFKKALIRYSEQFDLS